jgi:hypothetical protein
MANIFVGLLEHALFAETDKLPEVNDAPKLIVRLVLVVVIGDTPEVQVVPVGNVHVYVVAPFTGVIEYVAEVEGHIKDGPVKLAGVLGVVYNVKLLSAPLVHALFALTDMTPLKIPEEKFTIIEVPVVVTGEGPEREVIPGGNVHV